jgi:hypothetical protein
MTGFICSAHLYEYNGWLFEESMASGPWPLKKNGDPRKRAGKRFYDMYSEFDALPDDEKAKYFIGGGCERIGAAE